MAAQPSAAQDYAAELEKLAQLKAQGIITEEEFEAKKKQILGI
jgi:predicted Zn-dependent peptidase